MELQDLKKKLEDIDALRASGAITEERAKLWKDNIVAQFEKTEIPSAPEKELPNDLAHLPGRLVGKMIKGFGNMSEKMAQNAADRIAAIERENTTARSDSSKTRNKDKERKKKEPFGGDLPPIYR